jgi:hypothetical protein
MRCATSSSVRKVVGLGFLPEEARHGFLIDIPKGSGGGEMICITEHRGSDLDHLGARAMGAPSPGDPSLRVVIDRTRWLALAPAFWEEANRRLRANGLPAAKFQKTPASPFRCIPLSAKNSVSSAGLWKKPRPTTSQMPFATGRRSPPRSAGGSTL